MVEVHIKQNECPRPGCGGKLLNDDNNELYCINCGWRQNTPLDDKIENNKKPRRSLPAHNTGGKSKYSLKQRVEIARQAKLKGAKNVSIESGISRPTIETWVRNLPKMEERLAQEISQEITQGISSIEIKDIHDRLDTMKLISSHSGNMDLSTKINAWLQGYIEALEWVLDINGESEGKP